MHTHSFSANVSSIIKAFIYSGLASSVVAVLVSFFFGFKESALISMCLLAFFVILSPMLMQKNIDPMQPLTFAAITTLFGTTLRSLYLLLEMESENHSMLDGRPLEFALSGALWIIIGLLFVAVGYSIVSQRLRVERLNFLQDFDWPNASVLFIVATSVFVSAIGFYFFVTSLDFAAETISDLSSKRGISSNSLGQKYTSLGYLRWLSQAAVYGFFLLLIYNAYQRRAPSRARTALLSLVFLIAAIPPFFSSSRSSIIYTLMIILVVQFYTAKSIKLSKFIGVFLVFCVIFFGMAALRNSSNETVETEFGITTSINQLIGSGNFLPVARTGVIINSVPNKVGYLYGQTWVNWLVGPIPRSMWDDKPVISVGITVKEEIYGYTARKGGYPPGLIGEAYMNFGFVGVIIICTIYGMGMRIYYNSFQPLLAKNKVAMVVYVCPFPAMIFDLLGGDVSRDITGSLMRLISMAAILILLQRLNTGRRIRPHVSVRESTRLTNVE